MVSRTSFGRATRGSAARRLLSCAFVAVTALAVTSCGETVRTGNSSVYLVMNQLGASPGGGSSSTFDTKLSSDVVTSGTAYEDLGQVTISLGRKDITSPISSNNYVTISRYHVDYVRSDGRNTPGVDVPYGFDGAVTFTVTEGSASGTFVLVRAQAKLEPPLISLRGGGGQIAISTIAQVTFYGRDQVGNDVSVAGSLGVNFADWGDPAASSNGS
jgi:hypothetical protein